jgi:hypothetical protein
MPNLMSILAMTELKGQELNGQVLLFASLLKALTWLKPNTD